LLDLEESINSPTGSPGVGTEPVIHTVFVSPTENLDGVSSFERARDVVVDSTLVVHEVRVDSEGSLHRSVGIDLSLDLSWSGGFNNRALGALIFNIFLSILALSVEAVRNRAISRSVWEA